MYIIRVIISVFLLILLLFNPITILAFILSFIVHSFKTGYYGYGDLIKKI